ncbi:MAG: Gfo/Idh/MocA family oxidoreductase [Treponema sp.]|nr:Gfo/Idh/MocA family oxidoreductase [Treponema sp.]
MQEKARFVIIGSGWRASFYVRIAKALPERFELLYMLCRSAEKAEKISKDLGIPTTTRIQDCVDAKPDFVVVAVTKSSMTDVSLEWLDRGFFVLAETPAALSFETIKKLKNLGEKGNRLIVAEQYRLYPENAAILSVLENGLIGEATALNISIAHEYHAASLIRAFLKIPTDMKFSVRAKTYEFPTTETLTRYEHFTDGRIASKKRTVATFEFKNGKVAFYDFDSEQYRSPIRKNTLKIQGVRGEIIGRKVYYLDEKNEGREGEISFETAWGVREFTEKNFSHDEMAIASLMQKMYSYVQGKAANPYPLEEAVQDSFMAILMQKSIESGGGWV